MSKKCTPLWREAHFEVKNPKITTYSDHFFTFRCRCAWQAQGEHQIFRFADMILRDRCSTSYDLASLFRGRRSTLDRWSGKIAKRVGTRLCTQLSIFEGSLADLFCFWSCQFRKMRKSRKIVSFLMLSNAKIEKSGFYFCSCQVQN